MKKYKTSIEKGNVPFGEIYMDEDCFERCGVWKNGNDWIYRDSVNSQKDYQITPEDIKELNKSLRKIADCGSNSCKNSRHKGGMRTNSRCRCAK